MLTIPTMGNAKIKLYLNDEGTIRTDTSQTVGGSKAYSVASISKKVANRPQGSTSAEVPSQALDDIIRLFTQTLFGGTSDSLSTTFTMTWEAA